MVRAWRGCPVALVWKGLTLILKDLTIKRWSYSRNIYVVQHPYFYEFYIQDVVLNPFFIKFRNQDIKSTLTSMNVALKMWSNTHILTNFALKVWSNTQISTIFAIKMWSSTNTRPAGALCKCYLLGPKGILRLIWGPFETFNNTEENLTIWKYIFSITFSKKTR